MANKFLERLMTLHSLLEISARSDYTLVSDGGLFKLVPASTANDYNTECEFVNVAQVVFAHPGLFLRLLEHPDIRKSYTGCWFVPGLAEIAGFLGHLTDPFTGYSIYSVIEALIMWCHLKILFDDEELKIQFEHKEAREVSSLDYFIDLFTTPENFYGLRRRDLHADSQII